MSHLEKTNRHHPTGHNRPTSPHPELMMPAMPPLELIESMRKRVVSLRQRRQLRKLLSYDDHTLTDMGHSRAELLHTLHRSRRTPTAYQINNIHLQNMHPGQQQHRHQ